MKKDIAVVLTTFFPNKKNFYCISKICEQFSKILIYDNSASLEVKKKLLSLKSKYVHLELIFNPKNLGIASSLNSGVLKLNKYEWILFFDQDTLIQDNLNIHIKKFIANNKFDILGLNYQYSKNFSNNESFIESSKRTIISGMLVNSLVFNSLTFRNNFLLDLVDHDFCFRAKNKGFRIFKTKQPLIKHSIGNMSENKFLFIMKKRLNHNNFRYYLIARNKIWFDKLNKNHLCINTLWKLIFEFFLIILFDKQVVKKLRAHFFGIYHGLSNKSHDLPSIIKRFGL